MVLSVGTALAGPCDTTGRAANLKDAGSGPASQGSNPAGVKGLGELGNVGTNAAVCNAIFNATGQRIRRLPVRLEQVEI